MLTDQNCRPVLLLPPLFACGPAPGGPPPAKPCRCPVVRGAQGLAPIGRPAQRSQRASDGGVPQRRRRLGPPGALPPQPPGPRPPPHTLLPGCVQRAVPCRSQAGRRSARLQGIFQASTYIHSTTEGALRDAARRFPGWPLLLTGHSLGGEPARARRCCVQPRRCTQLPYAVLTHPLCMHLGPALSGGVAALLTLLLMQSGLPQGLGPVRCITIGTGAPCDRGDRAQEQGIDPMRQQLARRDLTAFAVDC